jgi:glucose/arabinose dehydrogenase
MRWLLLLGLLLFAAAAVAVAERKEWGPFAQEDVTSAGPVRLAEVADLDSPTFLGSPPGDPRQFVTERAGRVRVIRDGRVLGRPFLDISADVTTEGEGGLLSIAFAPDYESSGRFYVYYVDRRGRIRIDGLRVDPDEPDRADAGSRVSIIAVAHTESNHKGGQLQFGPDGYLYAGFGDGGGQGDPDRNGQDLGELLGKLVRIDPRPDGGYDVPADNPFVDEPGARPEIYAYGLRNPWRFSFDRETGDLVIADVGQEEVEEIDFVPRGDAETPPGGQNFGWSIFEGNSRFRAGSAPGHVRPVLEGLRDDGFCSIIGGYVVRDRSLGRDWYGRYVYGDLCNATLRRARLSPDGAQSDASGLAVTELVSFGEDAQGRIYAISLKGSVYRLTRD